MLLSFLNAIRPPVSTPGTERDTYLSDGHRLFRVVSQMDPRLDHPMAVLEDCRTLSLDLYSAEKLYVMGVRRVRPATTLECAR